VHTFAVFVFFFVVSYNINFTFALTAAAVFGFSISRRFCPRVTNHDENGGAITSFGRGTIFIDRRGFEIMSQAKNVSGNELTAAAPKIQVFLSFRPSATDLIQIREFNYLCSTVV